MRLKTFLWPLLLSVSLAAVAANPNEAKSGPPPSALDPELLYQILLGEISARSNDGQTAFSLLLDAAHKTGEPKLFLRAVQLALQMRSGRLALQAARDWSRLHPDSWQANRFVLEILLDLNRVTDTKDVLKREIELAPKAQRAQIIWSWPAKFESVSERAAAALVVQQALGDWLQDPGLGATAWAVVGRLWQQAGNKARALDAAVRGLAIDGKSEHAALLALFLFDQQTPAAENLVRQYLPYASLDFRLGYAKALLGQQRPQEAQRELQAIRKLDPAYPDAWLLAALQALQDGQPEAAQKQLEGYIALSDKLPPAQQTAAIKRGRLQALFFLSKLARQARDFAAAQAWLARIDDPKEALQVDLRRADVLAAQGQIEQALALIAAAPQQAMADARTKSLAQAQLLYQYGQLARAKELLQQLLLEFPDDLDITYSLALVFERLGDLQQMEQLLRRLIAARPNDANAYNTLGYALVNHNVRLPEAMVLIEKALQLSPDDPAIIDSLAWLHFRHGKVELALQLLRRAFKAQPEAEIAAHLGEVLWQAGQQSEALQVFRTGLRLDPDDDVLQETLQRLGVKP